MAAGIQVIGSSGAVQIDDSYSNLGLAASGTLTLTLDPATHPQPMQIGTITYTGQTPLLAFAATSPPINIERCTVSGNTYTYRVRTQSWSNVSVSYWIFDTAALTIGSSAPEFLLINDAYGNMVFHGGMKPLAVVDFITLTMPPNSWDGGTYNGAVQQQTTYPAGRSYAVIQATMGVRTETFEPEETYWIPEPGNKPSQSYYMHSAATVDGSTVTVGLETFESWASEQPTYIADTAASAGALNWLVVDVTGYGTAPPTTDVTPNAIDWPNVSLSTTSNTGSATGTSRTLSGITSNMGLRIEVTGYSGNLTSGTLTLLRNGSSAGSVTLTGGSFEATVSNGDALSFQVSGTTASGIRSGSATVTVKNISLSGSPTLDTFTASATVDSDNNYNNADYTPDAVNWANQSASSNDYQVYAGVGSDQYLTGFNTPITVRVSISGVTGNLTNRLVSVYIGGSYNANISASNGSYQDFTISPNTYLGFITWGETTSGTKSGGWTVTVTNVTTGATIDTFTTSLTADADNNYNVTDLTPDAVDWPNLSDSSNSNTAQAGAGFYQYFSGITDPISVRVSISSVSSNLSVANLYCYDTGTYYGSPTISNGGYIDRTFHPGDGLGFIAYGETYGGIRSGSWTVTVTNLSTGATPSLLSFASRSSVLPLRSSASRAAVSAAMSAALAAWAG